MSELREQIAIELFKDDIVHGHLQYWESPTADWDKASLNLKKAYYLFADQILSLISAELDKLTVARLSPFEDPRLYSFNDGCQAQLDTIKDQFKKILEG